MRCSIFVNAKGEEIRGGGGEKTIRAGRKFTGGGYYLRH